MPRSTHERAGCRARPIEARAESIPGLRVPEYRGGSTSGRVSDASLTCSATCVQTQCARATSWAGPSRGSGPGPGRRRWASTSWASATRERRVARLRRRRPPVRGGPSTADSGCRNGGAVSRYLLRGRGVLKAGRGGLSQTRLRDRCLHNQLGFRQYERGWMIWRKSPSRSQVYVLT
jgi:hypothetical protein